jgi:hypothetical protein
MAAGRQTKVFAEPDKLPLEVDPPDGNSPTHYHFVLEVARRQGGAADA